MKVLFYSGPDVCRCALTGAAVLAFDKSGDHGFPMVTFRFEKPECVSPDLTGKFIPASGHLTCHKLFKVVAKRVIDPENTARTSGPIRLTDPPRMSGTCAGWERSAAFTAESPDASQCRSGPHAPMRRSRQCAPMPNTPSRTRRDPCGSSSGRSDEHGPLRP